MATRIESNFIGQFITGDNINYNLKTLNVLYEVRKAKEDSSLNKPITLTIVSVIEAVLYDLFWRISNYTIEGVEGIKQETVDVLKEKHLDTLDKSVTHSKKHELLGKAQEQIYKDMDSLRLIRNRIHIQNQKGYKPDREHQVFTNENVSLAEITLERVLQIMTTKYMRDEDKHHVANFVVPWGAHLEWSDQVTVPVKARSWIQTLQRVFD